MKTSTNKDMYDYDYYNLQNDIKYSGNRHKDLYTALRFIDPEADGEPNRWDASNIPEKAQVYSKNLCKKGLDCPDLRGKKEIKWQHHFHCICGEPLLFRHVIIHKQKLMSAEIGTKHIQLFKLCDEKKLKKSIKLSKGYTLCQCGCDKKIRDTTLLKYTHMKDKYIQSHLIKKFDKCYECKRYKDYDCVCYIENMNLSENKENEENVENVENKENVEDRENLPVLSTRSGTQSVPGEEKWQKISDHHDQLSEKFHDDYDLRIYELQQPFGRKEEFSKLNDYNEVCPDDIKIHDHFRYTVNVYATDYRKVVYAICNDKIVDDKIKLIVKGYKSKYPEYPIEPFHKYKKFRFYKRN